MLLIILLSLLLFLLLLVAFLLFAPILFEIDSRIGLFQFRIFPVFFIRWISEPYPGYAELGILGFRKKIIGKSEKKAEKSKGRAKPKVRKINFKKIIAVLNSFRIKKWFINIDTGDMALNGTLFPLLYWLGRKMHRPCQINFLGKTEVIMEMENNFFRMLKAYHK